MPSGPLPGTTTAVARVAAGTHVLIPSRRQPEPSFAAVVTGRAPAGLSGSISAAVRMVARGTLGVCATQLGVTEEALRRTAEYAGQRVQFERPIATFQAVGHRCADAYIDVEGIRLTLWQAAWRVAAGLPAATEIEVAKLWAAEGGHRVAHTAVHIHGGMGVAIEYPIHRYFVAAKQTEFMLGGATEQRLRIGSRLAAEAV